MASARAKSRALRAAARSAMSASMVSGVVVGSGCQKQGQRPQYPQRRCGQHPRCPCPRLAGWSGWGAPGRRDWVRFGQMPLCGAWR
jgi:hypothetical protein